MRRPGGEDLWALGNGRAGAWRRGRALAILLLAGGGLSACSTVPNSGPTAHEIEQDQKAANPLGFQIVNIDSAAVRAAEAQAPPAAGLASLAEPGVVDAIGPGDVLQITVFEVGATLFSGGQSGALSATSGMSGAPPTAAGENFPPVAVNRDGAVSLPYIGRLVVAGRTSDEVESLITEALKGKSQSPQVIVSVHDNVANSVVVMGDVKKPGRLPLTLAHERLLDAVADAQGGAYPTEDLVVRIARHGRIAKARLSEIVAGSPDDLVLLPQDRVEVIYQPRSYVVFGAAKVAETPFTTPRVSLAEAVARVGGPLDQQADPRAVFVFRYEPETADGQPTEGARPVAYRLDMMRPESYFLSTRFKMHPHDVIYIANARINQIAKLMQVFNLFFSPAYTAKVVSQ